MITRGVIVNVFMVFNVDPPSLLDDSCSARGPLHDVRECRGWKWSNSRSLAGCVSTLFGRGVVLVVGRGLGVVPAVGRAADVVGRRELYFLLASSSVLFP